MKKINCLKGNCFTYFPSNNNLIIPDEKDTLSLCSMDRALYNMVIILTYIGPCIIVIVEE